MFEKLSKIAPDSTDTKFLQARVYAADGKTEEAIKILDSIENPSPKTVHCVKNLTPVL